MGAAPPSGATARVTVEALAATLQRSWQAAASEAASPAAPGLALAAARLAASRERLPSVPSTRPAVAHLPAAVALARGGPTASLAEAAARAADSLAWTIGYSEHRDDPAFADFLAGYAFAPVVGPAGPLVSDDLAVYLTLQAPGVTYPLHAHPAVELYQVLAGRGLWLRDGEAWLSRAPGDVILHASGQGHAMRTLDQPMLSVAIWLDHLDQPARMVAAPA